MKIYKKTWPKLFKKIVKGKKNVEFRVADFKIKKGDILVLKEYDPKTKKYTSRSIEKKAKEIHKIYPLTFFSLEDLKKYGAYLIEIE